MKITHDSLFKHGLQNGRSYLAPLSRILIRNDNGELFLDIYSVFRHNPIEPSEKTNFINHYAIINIEVNQVIVETSSVNKKYIEEHKNNDFFFDEEPYVKISQLSIIQ